MIRYEFLFSDAEPVVFAVDETASASATEPEAPPAWMELSRHRCANCPLPEGSRKTCPAALAIGPLLETIGGRISYEPVRLRVQLGETQCEAVLPMQDAVRSLGGLLIAMSDCPIMSHFRPMAHFHVPFADSKHTLFRAAGMILIAEYLRNREGIEAGLSLGGLKALYEQVHRVNDKLAARIRAATQEDAAINGLIILDTFARLAERTVDQSLADLRGCFSAYLDPDSPVKAKRSEPVKQT